MAYHNAKMATCCYCGRRTTLVLTGVQQHELACAACGAPLRDLKALPAERRKPTPKPAKSANVRAPVPEDVWSTAAPRQKKKKKGRRRRKSLSRRVASELFDLVEEIFD